MAFSNYLEDEITGWINGTTFDAAPTSTFIQLYSQDPTESGSATGALYTRVSVAAGGWTRETNGGGTLTNTNVITITSSAPSGATATHFAVFDSSTGGNMLFYGSLTAPQVIGAGDEVKFNASTLVLIVSVLLSNLLDLYPNAAVAYSLRKLRTAYAGSAIRVRRSSDNTEQDIGFDANGNLDTVALLLFCGVGNGFVTTWYDQSGNANNATQATAAAQPQIVSSGVVILQNTKPIIKFATTNRMNISLINREGLDTSFFITYKKSSLGSNTVFLHDVNTYLYLNYTNTQYYGSVQVIDADFDTTNYMLISVTSDYNVKLNFYKNNVLEQSKTTGISGAGQRVSILFDNTVGQRKESFTNEIIIYPTDQDANASAINTNINTYYGIY